MPQSPTTRLIIISDLHLGGVEPPMMSQPQRLAEFLEHLPALAAANETLELVIAGDFIDFLAILKFASWTPDPRQACAKLRQTLDGPSAPVFAALARYLAAHSEPRLTILLGNHDLELSLPVVQQTLLQALGGRRHQVAWIDDGRAYCLGGVLIEHGNRYDGANINDWDGLRALRSAQSRYEEPPGDGQVKVSAGSEIVTHVVNPLKPHYPFIDLLQPQNALVALLLLAFEPELLWDWPKIAQALKGHQRQQANPSGGQPGQTYAVSASVPATMAPALEAELKAAFGTDYDTLMSPGAAEVVGARDWLRVYLDARQHSLAELLRQGQPLPPERLRRIRAALCGLVSNELFRFDADAGAYGQAAKRMQANGAAEVVVMGHTHLARHHGPQDKASYINTGTWADLITVPDEALER